MSAMSAIEDLPGGFRSRAWVDDPFLGPVVPERFEADSPLWPQHPRWASVEWVKTVAAGARSIDEFRYLPADDAARPVPVAVVWDDSDAEAVARVYCNKALVGGEGADRIRPPIRRADPDLRLHPALAAYRTALAAGDAAGIVATLSPDFRARIPTGAYHEGGDIRADFADRFASAGGVPLEFVTATDDGSTVGAEFISWRVPPHAGLGVYDRAADGRIREFRSYEGPVLPKPGGRR